MNPMEKQITKINTTSKNKTYLVENQKNMCQHNKLHPLTSKREKLKSETMYRDIEKSFNVIQRNTSLQRVKTIYQIRN